MPGIWYSTGSSMVRILRLGSLISASDAASVVVLPDPVGPVTTIMPKGACSVRRGNIAQQTIDANAHLQRFAERLDMQIRGALLDRDAQQLVDRPHHRRPARQVAQVIEIVVRDGRLGRRGCTRFLRL